VTLFELLSRQRRFVYLVVGILSVAGDWAALRLPSAIYPELKFSRITIVAQGSTLGARQIVFSVTRPLKKRSASCRASPACAHTPFGARRKSRSRSRLAPIWIARCNWCGPA